MPKLCTQKAETRVKNDFLKLIYFDHLIKPGPAKKVTHQSCLVMVTSPVPSLLHTNTAAAHDKANQE